MKALTDDSPMPFGMYGPGQGDQRKLRDVPAPYLLWLRSQDFLYHWPALGDFIENKFFPENPEPPPKPKPAPRASRNNTMLKDFLQTLD